VADIRAKIAAGVHRPGDQIGSQHELAQQYQVSLITIKKALSELINQGVLFSRIGKGTYVAFPATSLARQKVIGLVLRDLKNAFFSLILHSVESAASQNSYNLLLANAADRLEKEEIIIQHFLELGVDGLIIASSAQTYRATPGIRKLKEQNFPYILVSYIQDPDIHFVGTDHELGGFLATEHLINSGYRKIGYINGGPENLLGEIRKQGYLCALKSHQLEVNAKFIFQLQSKWNDFDEGYQIGRQFLKLLDRPEAMFAFKDMVALGFEQALLDANVAIPGEVALVGFDDIERAQYAPVALTTIHQPTDLIGALAVKSILKQIEGEEIDPRTILQPSLVVRDSCAVKTEKVRE
jgi:DNA-binding LacI/PurR family transcriptional regulator